MLSNQPQDHTVLVQTDGGARGNPGPSGLGVVVFRAGSTAPIFEASQYVGTKTNNEAEYLAFLLSLDWVARQFQDGETTSQLSEDDVLLWQLDSKLVVEQLNKNWKIKQEHLQGLAKTAWSKLTQLPCSYTIEHIPRARNAHADALVNQALDSVQ